MYTGLPHRAGQVLLLLPLVVVLRRAWQRWRPRGVCRGWGLPPLLQGRRLRWRRNCTGRLVPLGPLPLGHPTADWPHALASPRSAVARRV